MDPVDWVSRENDFRATIRRVDKEQVSERVGTIECGPRAQANAQRRCQINAV